ncbi:ribosome-recycling factor, putative [Plasmodium malariae]|uniref:Ribosome-recycling factor, putative n=1 Tax=Plasmodium malariae TaxID=5858 RepID=A0A1C3KAT9_PLAMA|nr:ribosome-recycling factor, putative [Plasmodium malariae]
MILHYCLFFALLSSVITNCYSIHLKKQLKYISLSINGNQTSISFIKRSLNRRNSLNRIHRLKYNKIGSEGKTENSHYYTLYAHKKKKKKKIDKVEEHLKNQLTNKGVQKNKWEQGEEYDETPDNEDEQEIEAEDEDVDEEEDLDIGINFDVDGAEIYPMSPYTNEKRRKEKNSKAMTNDGANTGGITRREDSFTLKNYKIKKSLRESIKMDDKDESEDAGYYEQEVKKRQTGEIGEGSDEDSTEHSIENGSDDSVEDRSDGTDDLDDDNNENDETITEEDFENLNKMCSEKMSKVYNYIKRESYRFNLSNVSSVMFEDEKVKINERIYTIRHICHIKKKENLFTITPYDSYFVNFIYQHFVKEYNELKFYIKDKSVYAVVPPISENLKNEIKIKIKSKIDDAKVTLRNVRKQLIDKLEKIKNQIGKDIYFKQKNYIQSLHDQTKKQIEKLFEEFK